MEYWPHDAKKSNFLTTYNPLNLSRFQSKDKEHSLTVRFHYVNYLATVAFGNNVAIYANYV